MVASGASRATGASVRRVARGRMFQRHHRNPELRHLRELKAWRHDANDRVRRTVDDDGATDGWRIGRIATLPEAVAQHHHRRRAWPVVFFGKVAAQNRMLAEQRKQIPGDRRSLEAL